MQRSLALLTAATSLFAACGGGTEKSTAAEAITASDNLQEINNEMLAAIEADGEGGAAVACESARDKYAEPRAVLENVENDDAAAAWRRSFDERDRAMEACADGDLETAAFHLQKATAHLRDATAAIQSETNPDAKDAAFGCDLRRIASELQDLDDATPAEREALLDLVKNDCGSDTLTQAFAVLDFIQNGDCDNVDLAELPPEVIETICDG